MWKTFSQEVLLRLFRGFQQDRKTYDPSRSFRGWLYGVAHHVLADLFNNRQSKLAAVGTGGTDALDEIHTLPARDDLRETLERLCDLELLEEAKKRVQERLERNGNPKTWEAFRLRMEKSLPGEEVARQLGMTRGHVFKACSDVRRMLTEETQRLDGGDTGGSS